MGPSPPKWKLIPDFDEDWVYPDGLESIDDDKKSTPLIHLELLYGSEKKSVKIKNLELGKAPDNFQYETIRAIKVTFDYSNLIQDFIDETEYYGDIYFKVNLDRIVFQKTDHKSKRQDKIEILGRIQKEIKFPSEDERDLVAEFTTYRYKQWENTTSNEMGLNVSTFTFKACDSAIEKPKWICNDWPTTTTTASTTTTVTTTTVKTTTIKYDELERQIVEVPEPNNYEPEPEYSENSSENFPNSFDFIEEVKIFNKAKKCVGSRGPSSGFCFSKNTGSMKTSPLFGDAKSPNSEDLSPPSIDFSFGEEFTGGIFAAYFEAPESMIKPMPKDSSLEVNSQVVALQIGDSICDYKICSSYKIQEGDIKMVFPQFENRLEGETKCSYWNMTQKQWATNGVSMVARNETHITCTTNHLTNFATVHYMYPGNGRVSSKGLEITSNIVCGTSIISLIVVFLAMIRKIRMSKGSPVTWSRRSKQPILIAHLAIALFIKMASIMTLSIFDDSTVLTTDEIDFKCTTNGIILASMVQFAQLASICWMSCQAIDHYVKITRVAEGNLEYPRRFMNFLLLLGWGFPTFTILAILILFFNKVEVFVDLSISDVERICWVNAGTLYVCWVIPFACFFMLNLYIFGKVMSTIIQMRRTGGGLKRSDTDRLRRAMRIRDQTRVASGLVVLFGISYFLAPFMYASSEQEGGSYYQLIVTYSFVIINGLQGLWIFIFYVALPRKSSCSSKRGSMSI